MTKRIAVVGARGIGKTTVIRRLNSLFKDDPQMVRGVLVPQYHENEHCPFSDISSVLETIKTKAESAGEESLGTVLSFLAMTLYGEMELSHLEGDAPRLLFMERHPVIEMISLFRSGAFPLRDFKDPRGIENFMESKWGPGGPEKIFAYWERVRSREGQRFSATGFNELPSFLNHLSSSPDEEKITRLEALADAGAPDAIHFLTISPASLRERILAGSRKTDDASVDESVKLFMSLQSVMSQTCEIFGKGAKGVLSVRIDISGRSPQQVARQMLEVERLPAS